MNISVYGDDEQMETVRKVKRIINGIQEDRSVCIYGSGEHTAQLFRYTAILHKNLQYVVVEGDLAGCEQFGMKISSLPEMMADMPDVIVISSYERQEEMADTLKNDFSYTGDIIQLYDKTLDPQSFFADLFHIQIPALANEPFKKYIRDLNEYIRLNNDPEVDYELRPMIGDDVPVTPIERYSFYQDTWCAGNVFADKPDFHVDIGSTPLLVGVLSQFTRVCSVDIRPLPIRMNGLECRKGSIVQLPFGDRALNSISSLSVIEHIGLGRFGDEIDPRGREKAVRELARVLAVGGNLYVSAPIGQACVEFNAGEIFDLAAFISLFADLRLVDARFIHGNKRVSREEWERYRLPSERTVGLFHFRREQP